MTETERKALALVNEVQTKTYTPPFEALPQNCLTAPLLRAIEQHEAFRQEVSDAVKEAMEPSCSQQVYDALKRFHIAKPDPLVEALSDMGLGMSKTAAAELRTALAARGLEIREMGQ